MANSITSLSSSAWGFWVVSTLLISPVFGSSVHPSPKKRAALFVFGDSLFDPGNNNYFNTSGGNAAQGMGQATNWPYGETYFRHPTGRLSDGRIVPDFIGKFLLNCPNRFALSDEWFSQDELNRLKMCAAEFFKLPIWKPYLQPGVHTLTNGANFASGGAGVLSGSGNHPGTISLSLQLSYFKEVVSNLKKQIGESQTQKLLHSAVYLISMGGNDYFGHYNTYPNASASSIKQFVGVVTRNLTEFLEEIYDIGGRKIAFQNVGALGCVPINVARSADGKSCLEKLSAMARLHNFVLSKSLERLERRLPGFKYSIFNYYNAILDRVHHPTKYGFENGTRQCYSGGSSAPGAKVGKETVCKDPRKYVWFDGGHTTEACNWQLAKLMWKGKRDIVRPYNFRQLYEL
ncbi:hypothetical protein V2J09_023392 [Rumex salicifolius]